MIKSPVKKTPPYYKNNGSKRRKTSSKVHKTAEKDTMTTPKQKFINHIDDASYEKSHQDEVYMLSMQLKSESSAIDTNSYIDTDDLFSPENVDSGEFISLF